jgi:hypothetical protein
MELIKGIIFGVVSIIFIIPLLQSLSDLFYALFQWFISWINIRITYNNAQATEIQVQHGQEQVSAIGFEAPNKEEEYFDEDKIQSKNNRKVGF